MKLNKLAPLAIGAVAALTLAGCAQGGTSSGGDETISLRLWDEKVADAYQPSIDAFMAANPGITVQLNVVPWSEYFTTLRADVAAGSGDDVFWLNGSYYQDYADNALILPIDEALGADAAAAWNPAVVEQYTKDGHLWGVPQITDGGSALYVNVDALAAAGVTEAELQGLVWNPSDPASDTLLPLLQRLTLDSSGRNAADPAFDPNSVTQYAINAAQELQNIELNFIGSNGGSYQGADGALTFTDPKTVEAYQYLVDLINEYRVAPPASSTNDNGDYNRDQFLQGNMALFLSGTYNLANVRDGASFEWGLTEMPAGPAGQVTTSPGVIAAGNAASAHPEAVTALLRWLGSAEGNEYIGAAGAAVPAVTAARAAYDTYWNDAGVDVTPFFSVLEGNAQIAPVTGQNYGAMLSAYKPLMNEVFLGRTGVSEGLAAAQDAGNAAA